MQWHLWTLARKDIQLLTGLCDFSPPLLKCTLVRLARRFYLYPLHRDADIYALALAIVDHLF